MSRDYTTTKLLSSLKQRAMIPTSQSTYSDSDLLTILNDTLRDYLCPLVMSTREEFFVTSTDETIGSTTTFNIPQRALGSKLRDVLRVMTSGSVYSVPRLEPESLEFYNDSSSAEVSAFYLQADQVKLKGTYSSNDTLRLKWFRRPNKLVAESACAKVSSVDGNEVTCESIPTAWTTASTLDVLKGIPHFRSLGDDQTITAITTTVITFTSAPTGIVAGDWISLADEACVAQIPYDLYPLLEDRAAITVLEDLGDSDGVAIKERRIEKKEVNAVSLLSNRVEGENRKIVNRQNLAWKRGNRWGS